MNFLRDERVKGDDNYDTRAAFAMRVLAAGLSPSFVSPKRRRCDGYTSLSGIPIAFADSVHRSTVR